jgi:ribose 5-phosphate isomerase A
MDQNELKRQVAKAALPFIDDDCILGVGTGSTVNCLIDALAASGKRIEAAVSSSEESTRRLEAIGIKVLDLNAAGPLDLYIDGADEFDTNRYLIKGGGGALTREKIIAEAAQRFVCIVDQSKKVKVLGSFPLPVEVIPMARGLVARKLVALGGQPEWREDFTTDNGNIILDVHNMDLVDAAGMERTINNIPGVVCCGIFALRNADTVLVSGESGIERY